jgi:hypothetical protein
MANSITSADLNQYKNLRIALKGLYDNISAGRIPESSGGNTFKTCHDNIFPTESDASYGNALRLTTTGTLGEAVINGNAISLQKLLINTLYPTFHQTIINDSYSAYTNNGLVTATGGNKDHLCFIKYAASSANILPDKYPITNILYSKYAIEIFIKINEALMNCYSSHTKDFDATFSSSTKIYIVDKKLKGDHSDNDAKGIYIKHSSSETGADRPPEGIYLYIGKLSNMFKDADIKMWVSNSPNAPIDITADYKGLAGPIFTSSNKLNIKSGTVYYFGYLEYSNDADTASKYNIQDSASKRLTFSTPISGSITSGLSGLTITRATIASGSTISSITIPDGTTIERVMTASPPGAVLNKYRILEAPNSIKLTISVGTTISTSSVNSIPQASLSAIKGTWVPASIDHTGSVITDTTTVSNLTAAPFTTNTAISVEKSSPSYSGATCDLNSLRGLEFVITAGDVATATAATFTSSSTSKITRDITDISTTTTSKDIIVDNIANQTKAGISLTGSFTNIDGAAVQQSSFYEQNIYYIYNFIKMIKYIDKASFLTTSKYLHIYILSYKSLLLASIRAANIFYNNRHRLNAVAISYENNFLNNTPEASGGSGCAKKSLNDFVKNDKKAVFSLTSTCTSPEALPADTYMGGDGFKYILYKTNGGTADNDVMFKDYDKRILEELDNLSNTKVKESTANLGITNFQIFSSFVLKGKFTITSYDSNVHDRIDGSFINSAPPTDYKILKDIFYNNKTYDFNKSYRIKIVNSVFKVIKFNTRQDFAGGDRIDIELEQDKTIPQELYNDLNNYNASSSAQIQHPVYIVKITSKDIDKDYNAIVKNTNTIEENINMYKTKIKNNTTLYELHKSRNNLLYNQVLSYLIIVAVIISILVIINVANVEKPLIKSITLACLAVIIILFMSYYIMNTLYIEEGFAEGSGSTHVGYDLCPTNSCKISNGAELSGNIVEEKDANMQKRKKDYVKNFLEYKAEKLMLMIILETPSIVNESLKGNNEKLVTISKNIYNDKLYLKDVLYSKKSDSEMNVDVLKYENKNYDIYIVCVLFLALIMVGSYTINIYTDNKYLDLLILIMVILFVCLFTYFVLYTNRVVRTVSTNYYWGNEYENQYI